MNDFLWFWYYRLQQVRLSVNAVFYYFITLQFKKSLVSIYLLLLIFINAVILMPIVILLSSIILMIVSSNEKAKAEWYAVISKLNISKESGQTEYKQYKALLFGDNK